MSKTKSQRPLVKVRAPVSQMRGQAAHLVSRLQLNAQGLIARSRTEILKEIRDLERRVVKGLHAATEEQVARLERRVATLEQLIAELTRKTKQAA